MERVKTLFLKMQVSIAGYGNKITDKQCVMMADVDKQVILVETRTKKQRYIIPFSFAIMEMMSEAELNGEAQQVAAKAVEAPVVKRFTEPQKKGVTRLVKDPTTGQITEVQE